jgi:DNA-binding MarR family transcriptional regulator
MTTRSLSTPTATPHRGERLHLGPLEGILGFHLARAAVTTYATFERSIGAPFALRKVEFSLLMLLLANAPVTPKQLRHALSLTAPKLSLLVDALAARGLVRREKNPADGRSQHLALTERGRSLARAAADAAVPMEQALLSRLTRAEHAMLIELLHKVAHG